MLKKATEELPAIKFLHDLLAKVHPVMVTLHSKGEPISDDDRLTLESWVKESRDELGAFGHSDLSVAAMETYEFCGNEPEADVIGKTIKWFACKVVIRAETAFKSAARGEVDEKEWSDETRVLKVEFDAAMDWLTSLQEDIDREAEMRSIV